MKKRVPVLIGVLVALAIMTGIIWGVTTDGGNVAIKKMMIAGDDGAAYSATLYYPQKCDK